MFPKININNVNNQEGTYDVTVGDEKFEKVQRIELDYEKCGKCKYNSWRDECRKSEVWRTFECRKNVETVKTVFNIFTAAILMFIFYNIFVNTEFAFFTKIALLIVSVVCMDVPCTLIESVAPKINDCFFYQKLKRNKAKQEKLEEEARKAEELKRQQEEAVTEMHEKILTECVDTILEFLESQRIKAIFDKASTEITFQASATNLKEMLEEEIKK